MNNEIITNVENKMKQTISSLESRLANIRTGRANPGLVEGVMVNCYGSMMPLNQIAVIGVVDARQLSIKPYDKSGLGNIEKAIFEANLGLTPNNNGETIFISVPQLTEERRREFVKQAKAVSEEAKVALRNIRQDGNSSLKVLELSEDEEKREMAKIQDLINKYNDIINNKVTVKEQELMQV